MSGQGECGMDAATVGRMLNAARNAAGRAYVPYSAFPVGAAVLTGDGSVISAVNVENASYGLTVCGERAAVFGAVAEGYRVVRAVAVSATRMPGATPCGACRQVLNEFKPPDEDLLVMLDRGVECPPDIVPLAHLLPWAFGPGDMADR